MHGQVVCNDPEREGDGIKLRVRKGILHERGNPPHIVEATLDFVLGNRMEGSMGALGWASLRSGWFMCSMWEYRSEVEGVFHRNPYQTVQDHRTCLSHLVQLLILFLCPCFTLQGAPNLVHPIWQLQACRHADQVAESRAGHSFVWNLAPKKGPPLGGISHSSGSKTPEGGLTGAYKEHHRRWYRA